MAAAVIFFGQAPDPIVRDDGSLSLVHAGGTVDGIEATVKNTLLYAYYGGVYIGRDSAYDANGKSPIGTATPVLRTARTARLTK